MPAFQRGVSLESGLQQQLSRSPLLRSFKRVTKHGERDCASESKLNRKFSGSEAVPVCISGIRMPTCWISPLQASGRIIDPANIPVLRRSDTPALLPMLNALSSRKGNLHLFPPPSSSEHPITFPAEGEEGRPVSRACRVWAEKYREGRLSVLIRRTNANFRLGRDSGAIVTV